VRQRQRRRRQTACAARDAAAAPLPPLANERKFWDYNTVKNQINENPINRNFRLAGLVIGAQHRLSKQGKNFGILNLEDFSGKTEFMLFGEDYVRYVKYLEIGTIVLIEGGFKQRFATSPYEFKISKFHLLETIKTNLTKRLTIELDPQFIDHELIEFLETNMNKYPGNTSLNINVLDFEHEKKIGLTTIGKGISVNDELIEFLDENRQLNVIVSLNT
jgi:DNA polymerase-3 subunit alpha